MIYLGFYQKHQFFNWNSFLFFVNAHTHTPSWTSRVVAEAGGIEALKDALSFCGGD